MFVFGTDGDTLRAWPLHTIVSISYHPTGSPAAKGKAELAIYLTNDTVAWLRGDEAEGVWKKIQAQGFGHVPPKP